MRHIMSQSWRRHLANLAASTVLSGTAVLPALAADGATQTPIKHVVVIFFENNSFDHYFGTYPDAQNPGGEPNFVKRDDTPAVNNLLSGTCGPTIPT
jgi:phospholipase C